MAILATPANAIGLGDRIENIYGSKSAQLAVPT
ncbi:hypothetical protein SAMN06295970_12638 [Noviherbaspirillum suwonense]|uniref:Uncharacterized protein n=1 Tax=Noviherbaspirillum suwonense TaxID=1224511 RepID=A0ABY1QS06_9BURK|nr:hypothetical protein SAMN06295970_12638 [Noviherbaspirillum suwonense]